MYLFERVQRGAILRFLLLILAALAVAGSVTYFFYCPCGVVPGGWLRGEVITEPVRDWSPANSAKLCQLQVSAGLPHSVNLNCMAAGGELFLSCASCAGKHWSTAALADPNARIRIDGKVYPVRLGRVTDPAVLDRAWRARASKLGLPVDTPRADGWWSFRAESR